MATNILYNQLVTISAEGLLHSLITVLFPSLLKTLGGSFTPILSKVCEELSVFPLYHLWECPEALPTFPGHPRPPPPHICSY